MSLTEKQIIKIHKLPYILTSKDNETVQLIEYNMRNTILQKPCRKWSRETSYRSLKKAWDVVIGKIQHLTFNIFR